MPISETPLSTQPPVSSTRSTEFSLLEFLLVVGRHKLLVFGLAAAMGGIALGASYLLPIKYRSTVALTSERTSAALLRGAAESEGVRDRVIERLHLAEHYREGVPLNVALRYDGSVKIQTTRDGLLSISAVDESASFAAQLVGEIVQQTIAAAHTELLSSSSKLLSRLKIQLEQVRKDALAGEQRLAENGLKDWRNVLGPSEAALLTTLADLQAEINQSQPDSTKVRESSTLLLQERLSGLQRQLAERGFSKLPLRPDLFEAVKDQYYLAALGKRLTWQIEIVSREMANEIRPIGPAPVPLLKESPKRSLIAAAAAAAGLLFGLLAAFVRESAAGPNRLRMAALRAAWGRRV